MLSDFLLLETYYEGPETVRFFEELSQKYGVRTVREAVQCGDLESRKIHCGPDCGRQAYWLSTKGREKASGV